MSILKSVIRASKLTSVYICYYPVSRSEKFLTIIGGVIFSSLHVFASKSVFIFVKFCDQFVLTFGEGFSLTNVEDFKKMASSNETAR